LYTPPQQTLVPLVPIRATVSATDRRRRAEQYRTSSQIGFDAPTQSFGYNALKSSGTPPNFQTFPETQPAGEIVHERGRRMLHRCATRRANQFAFAIAACPAPPAKLFLFFRNRNQAI